MIHEVKPSFLINKEVNPAWPTESDAQLRAYWRHYSTRGHQFNKQGNAKKAAMLFSQCIQISNKLLHSPSQNNELQSGIELFFFASHNLAACQNQLHQGTAAEHTLYTVYETIIKLCTCPRTGYKVKLDALAILDKCLFSFVSQLAYLGKIEPINGFIKNTEEFAERTISFLNNRD